LVVSVIKLIKQIENKMKQMIEKKMGLVIGTPTITRGGQDAARILSDPRCFKCRQEGLYINKGNSIVDEFFFDTL
jgi:hypothetical protein